MSLLELLLPGAGWGSPIATEALLIPILGFPSQFQGSYLNSWFPILFLKFPSHFLGFPSQFLCSHPGSWIPVSLPWRCYLTFGVLIPFSGVPNSWVPTSLPGIPISISALLVQFLVFPSQFLVFLSQFLASHSSSWCFHPSSRVVDSSSQGFIPSS